MKKVIHISLACIFLISCSTNNSAAYNTLLEKQAELEVEMNMIDEQLDKLIKKEQKLTAQEKTLLQEIEVQTSSENKLHEQIKTTNNNIAVTTYHDTLAEFLSMKDELLEELLHGYMSTELLYTGSEYRQEVIVYINNIRPILQDMGNLQVVDQIKKDALALQKTGSIYESALDRIEQAFTLIEKEKYEESTDLFYEAMDELIDQDYFLSNNYGRTSIFEGIVD